MDQLTLFFVLLAAVILYKVVKLLVAAHKHPAHVLGRQAAKLGWVAKGIVKDSEGNANTKVGLGPFVAIISFKDQNVRLLEPTQGVFRDFLELEKELGINEVNSKIDPEVDYYVQIENSLRQLGHYEKVLHLQGTDRDFCTASLKFYKAAFAAQQSPKVAGALVAEAAHAYEQDKRYGLVLLEKLKDQQEST